mmetsp:Transcript_32165/g.68072  ORF Transcript_32165/g.68072 Transcript_32165/m.68072 type:complete len:348 (-) Transcript_32165:74-1117(-)
MLHDHSPAGGDDFDSASLLTKCWLSEARGVSHMVQAATPAWFSNVQIWQVKAVDSDTASGCSLLFPSMTVTLLPTVHSSSSKSEMHAAFGFVFDAFPLLERNDFIPAISLFRTILMSLSHSSSSTSEMHAAVAFDFGVFSLFTSVGFLAAGSLFLACFFVKNDWIVPATITGPFFCFFEEDTLELAKKDESSSSTETLLFFVPPFDDASTFSSTAFNPFPLSPSTTLPKLPTLCAIIFQRVMSTDTSSSLQIAYMTFTELACPILWHLSSACAKTPGVQCSSAKIILLAAVKVKPTPAAVILRRATRMVLFDWNFFTHCARSAGGTEPSILIIPRRPLYFLEIASSI